MLACACIARDFEVVLTLDPATDFVASRWRYALMNRGYDPLKERLCREP